MNAVKVESGIKDKFIFYLIVVKIFVKENARGRNFLSKKIFLSRKH